VPAGEGCGRIQADAFMLKMQTNKRDSESNIGNCEHGSYYLQTASQDFDDLTKERAVAAEGKAAEAKAAVAVKDLETGLKKARRIVSAVVR
jgi:hypothetical protein